MAHRGLVDVQVAVGAQADDGHRQRVGVEQLGEAALAFAKRRLGANPIRDVDQSGQDAEPSVDDDDVGVGDGHDLLAALRPEAGLDVSDRASGAKRRQPGLALARIDPDGDLRHGSPDDFVAGVAGGEKEGVVYFAGSLTCPGPPRKLLYQAVVAPGFRIHTLFESR